MKTLLPLAPPGVRDWPTGGLRPGVAMDAERPLATGSSGEIDLCSVNAGPGDSKATVLISGPNDGRRREAGTLCCQPFPKDRNLFEREVSRRTHEMVGVR